MIVGTKVLRKTYKDYPRVFVGRVLEEVGADHVKVYWGPRYVTRVKKSSLVEATPDAIAFSQARHPAEREKARAAGLKKTHSSLKAKGLAADYVRWRSLPGIGLGDYERMVEAGLFVVHPEQAELVKLA
jgi:hypothetical protein